MIQVFRALDAWRKVRLQDLEARLQCFKFVEQCDGNLRCDSKISETIRVGCRQKHVDGSLLIVPKHVIHASNLFGCFQLTMMGDTSWHAKAAVPRGSTYTT